MSNLITLCLSCHNIVEENPDEIYSCLPVENQPISKKNDWHTWVYGGCRRPK